jgi:hypothetical protein
MRDHRHPPGDHRRQLRIREVVHRPRGPLPIYGHRGIGLIEQDYLRRILLRELDRPGGIATDLIETNARFGLDHGYHAIIEGSCTPSATRRCFSG